MQYAKTIFFRTSAALLLLALAGCYYYPAPVYTAYPSYPAYPTYPAYPAYSYGYAPPPAYPQASPYATNYQECREYKKSVVISGERQEVSGLACRQPDGRWKDANNGESVTRPPMPKETMTGPSASLYHIPTS